MRRIHILLFLVAGLGVPGSLRAQENGLTSSSLPEFLVRFEKNLDPVDTTYADLENENLPLRDRKSVV